MNLSDNATYVAANALTITVKALYDFQATREDELSFCKHCIISNVIKEDEGW